MKPAEIEYGKVSLTVETNLDEVEEQLDRVLEKFKLLNEEVLKLSTMQQVGVSKSLQD